MTDKAVVYTSAVGKVVPAGYDRAAMLPQWPRWSLGIRVANLLFASGTGGTGPDGTLRHTDDPRAQGALAVRRLITLMEAGGARADDLVGIRVYVDDPANAGALLAGVGDVLRERLTGDYPAFSMVVANTSDRAVHAEIEAFAATAHESVRCGGVPPRFGSGTWSEPAWDDHAHAVRVGNLWFLSAQLPLDSTGRLVGTTAAGQTAQVLANLDAVLADSGRTASDLVRLTVWVATREALDAVQGAVRDHLAAAFTTGGGPATTVIVAPLVEPGALVQMEAVAATGARRVVDAALAPRPGALWPVDAVAVVLSAEQDSFVRRFTWPERPPDVASESAPARRPLGEIVFLSARTGTGTMGEQTRQALDGMRALAEAAGGCFADLVQFDVYYADRSLYADYNAVRIAYLEEHNPESAWFAGSGPRADSPTPGSLIEIESIAVIQR